MNSFVKSAVNKIIEQIEKEQKVVLGLPTGKTPRPIYKELIKKHNQGVDFSNVVVFQLDELLGFSADNKHSYQNYLRENFLNYVNIKEENCHFFYSKTKNYKKEKRRIEALIKKEGGIDLQILGIGKNGHIGYNEPIVKVNFDFIDNPDRKKLRDYNKFILNVSISQYEKVIKAIFNLKEDIKEGLEKEIPDKKGKEELVNKIKNQEITFFIAKDQAKEELNLPSEKIKIKDFEEAFKPLTHTEELSLPTLKSKAKYFDNLKELPIKAITLGTGTILNSRKVMLLASGGRKAEIIKKTLEEPVSINCPASLLRNHSDTSFVLDDAAASLLSLKEEKSKIWQLKAFLKQKYLSILEKERYLTIDLGGTYCRATLRDKEGKELFSPIKVKTLSSKGKEVILNQIIKVSRPLLKIGDPKKTKILLATAGEVNEEKGVIKESRNLGFKNFNIRNELKKKLPFKVKEIKVTNDIIAAWHGENKFTEDSNFVSFYSSTGIGGAYKDKNLEPGWKVALSLNQEDEVKTARFLGEKENGEFYKKSDLRKSEYFLEEVAGGPALISFAKEHASSFPKNKLAQKIKEGKVKNIPEELSKKGKEKDSFARYCLKRTGKYAGIGIVTIFNHFYEKKGEISLNQGTKFFINGSTGLNPFYFKGIKAGVGKGKELFENSIFLNNILHSKFKNSTEGVQKGLIYYYQKLKNTKEKVLPESKNNIIITDQDLPSRIETSPILEGKEVIVLEREKEDSEIFASNLIQKLKQKNVVKKVNLKKWKNKKFNPDLILAPEKVDINFEGPILFYKTFPSTEELDFNSYFEFDSTQSLLKSIRAYKEEIERTRYDIGSKFFVKYYGELLRHLSVSQNKFAHPFNIQKAEKGKIKEIKGITSIKNIIEREEGKNIFISPHADDMEITAGALVKWMLKNGEEVENWIITESHNEGERREKEAEEAKEILSNKTKSLKLDFIGADKEDLLKEEVKEKIKYQIKDINELNMVFLPSSKDSHPTHQKVRKLMEEMFLDEFDDFLIVNYFSPWTTDYDTYYISDKNHGKGKENKIASYLKEAIAKSGVLGELCSNFKEKGLFENYAEPFKRG